MSASSTNASAQTLMPLANSTFNNRVTQSGPLAVDVSFQFVDVRDLGAVDSLLKHTPHGVVNWVEVRWVRRPESRCDKMRYRVWIRCCKLPKYDFCISQGSVATVLRRAGQNSTSHLHQVSSWCCRPKIIKIGQCVTELFKNNTGTVFSETRCIFVNCESIGSHIALFLASLLSILLWFLTKS